MKAYVNMSDQAVEERNKEALEDLVYRVQGNDRGRPFDMLDFIAEQKDVADLLYQALGAGTLIYVRDLLESRLRAHLRDSQAVQDRAEELAQEDQS